VVQRRVRGAWDRYGYGGEGTGHALERMMLDIRDAASWV
jgi:hypothetical protein